MFAGFEVGHKDIAAAALVVNGDVNVLSCFVQCDIGMLGFLVQLGEVLEFAVIDARSCLVIAGDDAIFATGAHADVVRRAVRGIEMADDLLLLYVPDKDAMGFPAGTVAREQAPIAAIA